MIIRNINFETDYEVLAAWWTKQGWPTLPKQMLGDHGFVAEENELLAATWILPTGTSIYLMEWTIGNPEVEWSKRSEAIKQVTDTACQWAKQDGASQVITMTKNKRFIEKLQESGFIQTDSEMIHLVRSL